MSLIVFSTMFSSYFASITEHSFLCICKVFISKEFVRFSSSLGRFYAGKRIIQSKDLMPMSMHIQLPLQFNAFNVRLVVARSCVTLFKGQIPCGELIISFEISKNSLRGAKNLFREIENSFRGEIYNRLWEANKSSIVPSAHFFRETMYYLVLETMNKAITSPVFVEQRHLIERVILYLLKNDTCHS